MADKTQEHEKRKESSVTVEDIDNIPRFNLRCDGDEKSKKFLVKCRKCPEVSVYQVSLTSNLCRTVDHAILTKRL